MFQCCNDVQVGDNSGEGTSSQNVKFSEVHVKVEPLVHDTCRICLKDGKLAIFGANSSGVLCEYIYSITGVEITYEDPYPKSLCQTCYALLQGAIVFRKTALKSERKLKNLEIHSDDDIKDEEEKNTDKEQLKNQLWFANGALKERLLKKIHSDLNFDTDDFEVCPDSEGADNVCVTDKQFERDTVSETETKKTKTKRSKKRKWIKCLSCDSNFYTFTEFSKHRKDCRKITLGCAVCNEKFKKYQDFADHKRTEHEKKSHNKPKKPGVTKTLKEKAPHVCDICGKTFATKGIFTRHRSVHFNEKPFKCTMCPYQCRLKAALKRHQVIHFNDLPFKCALCPYRSRLKESLTMHMRSHTGEKPYQCHQCPSRFVSRSNLSKHVMRHKEHSFCCEVCSKGYYTKKELEIHIKDDHTEGKRHVCRFCEKSYSHRNAMMKHERKVHKRKNLISGTMPIYLKLKTIELQHETLSYPMQQNDDDQSKTKFMKHEH